MIAIFCARGGSFWSTLGGGELDMSDQSQPKSIVIPLGRPVLQGAARQTDHPACPSLRRRKLLARVYDGLTELPCRQALGFR